MPNNEDDFSNSPGFLKYKIEKLEEVVEPLIKLVTELDKKVGLLAQKMLIATALIGFVIQGVGTWYSSTSGSSNAFSEQEKIAYYEARIRDSEKIKALEAQLAELKKQKGN